MTQVPVELATYLDELVQRLRAHAQVDAVYLIGSAALGAYEPGSSDVDVVAVTEELGNEELRALAADVEALPCPARKLELVVYPRGSDRWQLNLNTGEHIGFDPDAEPTFWFVLDRALAEDHAIPLLGAPWSEVFEPVPRAALLDALDESLESIGALNTARAWVWLETGTWVSKPAAEAWLRARVRERLEEER